MSEQMDLDFKPDSFITLRFDEEEGTWELDLGDINVYEAIGVLECALEEAKDRSSTFRVRFAGAYLDDENTEDESDESDDE
jgi:hypothetical protein